MADQIKVTQSHAQVVTDGTPQLKVFQSHAQVVIDGTPQLKVTQSFAQVVVEVLSGAIIGSGGLILGGSGGEIQFIGGGAPVIPWSLAQISGSGGIFLGGSGVTTWYPGPGVVPGTWIIVQVVSDGTLIIGGAGEAGFVEPTINAVTGSGGAVLGGAGVIGNVIPSTAAIVAEGGLLLGSAGVVDFISPSITAIVGEGGVYLGGSGGVITSVAPAVVLVEGNGGVRLGYYRFQDVAELITPIDFLSVILGSGGIILGGDGGTVDFATPKSNAVVSSGGFLTLGGAGFISFFTPPILAVIGSGGIILGSPDEVASNEVYDTYILVGNNFEPSFFTNFRFNSYAVHRGKVYAAGDAGLYVLDGGDDDGAPIVPGVRIGPVNFGSDRFKRLRPVHLGACGPETVIRVEAGADEGYFEVDDTGHTVVSSDLEAKEFTLDIEGFAALSQTEITPLVLARR